VDTVEGRLRVRSPGDARWGPAVGDTCVLPLSWHGTIEVFEKPSSTRSFRSSTSAPSTPTSYGKNGRKSIVTVAAVGLDQELRSPRMETVTVDLHRPARGTCARCCRSCLPAAFVGDADATARLVTLAGAHVTDDGLQIDVAVAAPDANSSPLPEPPLDVKEIEQWDAFLDVRRQARRSRRLRSELRNALLGVCSTRATTSSKC
jgi:hypothetical protein